MAFACINSNILHYRWLDQNKDDNLILINSLGTSFLIWEKMIIHLFDHFNILLFDKRGHGLSSTSDGVLAIDDYADDVIGLMDLCSVSLANIVGLSIGGLITYSLASRFPERFNSLLFSNTGARIGTQESWKERINLIKKQGLSYMAGPIIERWLSKEYYDQHPVEVEGYQNMFRRNTVQGYIQACEAIANADFRETAKNIKHPTLFIGGSTDLGTTPEFVKKNASMVKDSKIEIIDGVGHLPCIEVPELMAQHIKNFIL